MAERRPAQSNGTRLQPVAAENLTGRECQSSRRLAEGACFVSWQQLDNPSRSNSASGAVHGSGRTGMSKFQGGYGSDSDEAGYGGGFDHDVAQDQGQLRRRDAGLLSEGMRGGRDLTEPKSRPENAMVYSRTATGRSATSAQPSSEQVSRGRGSRMHEAGVLSAIEGEIIPRLMLAYQHMMRDERQDMAERALLAARRGGMNAERDDEPVVGQLGAGELQEAAMHSATVQAHEVAQFSRLLIDHEAPVVRGFVDMLMRRGTPISDILLDLCAPAARELGDMWKRDDCSFCEVTIALSSLESIILHYTASPDFASAAPVSHPDGGERSVLLSVMPGNQHVFGLLIVKELFRTAGWMVRTPAGSDARALVQAVRESHFTIVGLSIARTDDLQACKALVHRLREESLNPRLLVIVGGNGIAEANPSTRLLDADLIARDGREGIDQIERMVRRLSVSRHVN
jgi:MerR family transcriptional regulator, light-induced transcriptional regulator